MKQAGYKDFIPGIGIDIVITPSEVLAINAVVDGTARPEDAKMAFEWIMREACQYGRATMILGGRDGERATDHLLGRQFVAQMIKRVISPEFYQRRNMARGTDAQPERQP